MKTGGFGEGVAALDPRHGRRGAPMAEPLWSK